MSAQQIASKHVVKFAFDLFRALEPIKKFAEEGDRVLDQAQAEAVQALAG